MEPTKLCRFLPWDSEFFGCRIARVESDHLTAAAVPAILAWCRAHAIDCLYLLSSAADQATALLALAHGFRQVDVRLTLARSLADVVPPADDFRDPLIREWRPEDMAPLAAIARAGHRDSRFYADPHFARSRCDALYETWLAQSCQSDAHRVLVAEWERQPVGYISCRQVGDVQGQMELLGVSASMRGRRLGRRLVQAALRWMVLQRLTEAMVVTQDRNVAAQRLYRRAGFETRMVQFWYHCWFNQPATLVA